MGQSDSVAPSFDMRFLDLDHLQEVIKFQEAMLSYQGNKSQFFPLTEGEFKKVFGKQGKLLGVFDDQRFIGFHAALFPHDLTENLGRDAGMEKRELDQVAHLESVAIHPDYRGNRLQYLMATFLIEYIKEHTNYRYLFETIAPDNFASIKNTLKTGMFIIQLSKKYGGLQRYLFYRDLQQPFSILSETAVKIDIFDQEKQVALLQAGYVGYQLEQKDALVTIHFGKVKEQYIL